MADPQDRLGQQMGEYRLLRLLGRGAFGAVYLAEHVHDGSQAAVKLLQIQLNRSEDFKTFLNEARSIRLHHPHIVPLLDFGLSREDQPFLVMEYAAGGTLRDRHAKGSRLPLPTMVSYVQQVASALQYAHERRVIHRDVKPENMLVRADGRLLLSDFGIATGVHSSHSINLQQGIGGTLPYMAPEQIQGKPRPASDQYALAVVVYEWITGQRPFQGTAVEMAMQHAMTTPPSLLQLVPTLSRDVDQAVLKALAKDPKERFASIEQFAQALHTAIEQPPVPASRNAPISPTLPSVTSGPSTPIPASQSPAAQLTPAGMPADTISPTALQTAGVQPPLDPGSARASRVAVGGVPTSSIAAPVDGASPTVQTNEQPVPALPPKVPSAETVASVPAPATSFATDGRAAVQAPLSVAQGKKPLPSMPITPSFLPARMRLPAGRAMVLALLVLLVVGSGGIWATLYVTTHRSPATPTATRNIFQMTAVVGHKDSVTSPSIFFAFDLHGQATILELPGGDPAYSRTYLPLPSVLLNGSNVSVTLRFQKLIGGSLPDMIVYAGQDIVVFENTGNSFSPASSSLVQQNGLPGPTSSNANYPLSWTSAIVGHNDNAAHPSDFLAANIRGQIVVCEFLGGDGSKGVMYVGPDLPGSGEDRSVPTLSFSDRNHDGKMDMIINVAGQQFVFYNDGTKFVPTSSLHVTATSDVHLTPTPSDTRFEGSVTFTNQGSVALTILTNTLVATRSGILFETGAEAVLEPSMSLVVPILGSKPGSVPANSITVIPQQSLQVIAQANNLPLDNLHLTVTNVQPTTGGGM